MCLFTSLPSNIEYDLYLYYSDEEIGTAPFSRGPTDYTKVIKNELFTKNLKLSFYSWEEFVVEERTKSGHWAHIICAIVKMGLILTTVLERKLIKNKVIFKSDDYPH